MTSETEIRTGGHRLLARVRAWGGRTVFGVPGESFLTVLDAFVDLPDMRYVTCRHEAAASHMAEAWGKLTGEPGLALVTRGPGASHAAIGVHTARHDSTPMILMVGQVPTDERGREPFQEVDFAAMFAPLAKWAAEVPDAASLEAYFDHAWAVALSGRPGPVVLSLPEDVLSADAAHLPDSRPLPEVIAPAAMRAPDAGDIERALAGLERAERPLLVIGGSGWSEAELRPLWRALEQSGIPVAVSFRRHDLVSTAHPCFAGDLGLYRNPELDRRIAEADWVLALGARLTDTATKGYSLLAESRPAGQRLIHVHPDPGVGGARLLPDVAVHGEPRAFAAVLAERLMSLPSGRWADEGRAAHAAFLAWQDPPVEGPNGTIDPGAVTAHVCATLPEDRILTVDAGNFAMWTQRHLSIARPGRILGPTSGAMGYAVAAAVAAKAERPEVPVVAFAGDGGFMMSGMELATAAHYGLDPIVLVFNNAMYGTIRTHQERRFPGRVSATDLTNPDIVTLARGLGCFAERVDRQADFPRAFVAAREAGRASVIEIVLPRERLAPNLTLSDG